MSAIGQLISYVIGSIDTVSIFGTTIGDTQFKQMTVIAALSLIIAVLVTSYAVKERVLIAARWVHVRKISQSTINMLTSGGDRDSEGKAGTFQAMSQLFKTTMDLPPRIQAICWAQFWAWIGKVNSYKGVIRSWLTHFRLVSISFL
jgi:solute carrier family 45 protein 1/2/4